MELYRKYSDYLKERYGCKVYKLPVNLPITCPNRIKSSGCTFCAEVGTGFEAQDHMIPVKEQLKLNRAHIEERYHAKKYIAYFQNYTNTYMPLPEFESYIEEVAAVPDIVEISISTRPDCISDDYLKYLAQFKEKTQIHINIELGLQTVNYHTLEQINRGHGLAEFIDAVLRIKRYDFTVCTHVILNLPGDDMTDVKEMSKILSVLPVDIVKIHSLYIAKTSQMAKDYLNGQLDLCDADTYIQRLVTFVGLLRPDMVIERLFSRIPEDDALFSNWGMSWWRLNDLFEEKMTASGTYQGKYFDYMNGSKLKF